MIVGNNRVNLNYEVWYLRFHIDIRKYDYAKWRSLELLYLSMYCILN